MVVVDMAGAEDGGGVEDVGVGDIEEGCALDCGLDCVVSAALSLLLLLLVVSLEDRDASAPPTPPPTAAATTMTATPTSIQNVLLRRPHIVCGGVCSYAAPSYAILFVSDPVFGVA